LYTSSAASARSKGRTPLTPARNVGTVGSLAMSNNGAELPIQSALSAPFTTPETNTGALTPPVQKVGTCTLSPIAASPPLPSAPTVRVTTLPPSGSTRLARPCHLRGPLSPPMTPPPVPLYSHPRTWTWTTCPAAALKQHYRTSLHWAPPSNSTR